MGVLNIIIYWPKEFPITIYLKKIGGRIVNIASMAGLWPNRGLRNVGESGYSMAKFGAIALARSFSQNDIFSKME